MKNRFKLAAAWIGVCVTLTSMSPVSAQTMSDITPAAGVAKVLDSEGPVRTKNPVVKDIKVVEDDTDDKDNKKEKKSEASEKAEDTSSVKGAVAGEAAATAGEVVSEKRENDILLSAGEPVVVLEEEVPTTDSTIKETAKTLNPAMITVGVESATEVERIAEATILEDSANLEIYEDGEEPTESYDLEDLLELKPWKEKNTEEEDFSNLVIARVNDYVNVRQEPDEESEIVGKLYNKSVGDLLEEAGDWYKIKSGRCVGYVKGEYVVTGEEAEELAKEVGTRIAEVTTTTLYVRKEASTDSEVIGMVPLEDQLLVIEELDGWVKVSVEEGDGYVSTEFVKLYTEFVRAESKEEEEARLAKEEAERKAAQEAARRASEKRKSSSKSGGAKSSGGSSGGGASYAVGGSGTGSSVANYALQFVGNPYVYGGSSLTHGTDCSGFVMSVYRNFGVSLPHSSGGDRGVGRDVGGIGNAQAGDIVCYSGHVGIYIGGGQIVHASTPSSGIKVSNAGYRKILAVRRIF